MQDDGQLVFRLARDVSSIWPNHHPDPFPGICPAKQAAQLMAEPTYIVPASAVGPQWTFTQGLLVGQLSIVVLAALFVRYFIFADATTALKKERQSRVHRSEQTRTRRRAKAQPSSVALDSILGTLGYNPSTHSTESADWLNVLLAQAVAGYREDVLNGGGSPVGAASLQSSDEQGEGEQERTARELMQDILNKSTAAAAGFLDPIRVTDVDCGDQFPVLSNAIVRPADELGRMRIEVQLDYTDHITIAIDTKLVVNVPKPRFAVLPISLSLAITRFSARVSIELFSTDSGSVLPTEHGLQVPRPPPESARSRHHLHFSLHPDFELDASVGSLLGSRAKLQDIPKIEQLLVGRLRAYIHDRFAWPRYWSLSLPNLVPSPTSNQDEYLAPPRTSHSQPPPPPTASTAQQNGQVSQPPQPQNGPQPPLFQVPDNKMTLAPGVEPTYLSPTTPEEAQAQAMRLAWAQRASMYGSYAPYPSPSAPVPSATSIPSGPTNFPPTGRTSLLNRNYLRSTPPGSVASGPDPIDVWRASASGVPSEALAHRRHPSKQPSRTPSSLAP